MSFPPCPAPYSVQPATVIPGSDLARLLELCSSTWRTCASLELWMQTLDRKVDHIEREILMERGEIREISQEDLATMDSN